MIVIKIIKISMILLFLAFICTVLLSLSGYYQTELQKKMILTQESIEQFEKDVNDGKDVDINNYINIKERNYDNNFTKSGRYISNKLNNIISTGIKKTLKIISKAIDD